MNRRERNPRNRLLCLQIHGEVCAVCDLDPRTAYGDAGSIIEVHHLQQLASSDKARHYDPAVDLVPLCPNCHKAVHHPSSTTMVSRRVKKDVHVRIPKWIASAPTDFRGLKNCVPDGWIISQRVVEPHLRLRRSEFGFVAELFGRRVDKGNERLIPALSLSHNWDTRRNDNSPPSSGRP